MSHDDRMHGDERLEGDDSDARFRQEGEPKVWYKRIGYILLICVLVVVAICAVFTVMYPPAVTSTGPPPVANP